MSSVLLVIHRYRFAAKRCLPAVPSERGRPPPNPGLPHKAPVLPALGLFLGRSSREKPGRGFGCELVEPTGLPERDQEYSGADQQACAEKTKGTPGLDRNSHEQRAGDQAATCDHREALRTPCRHELPQQQVSPHLMGNHFAAAIKNYLPPAESSP